MICNNINISSGTGAHIIESGHKSGSLLHAGSLQVVGVYLYVRKMYT